MTSDLHRYDVAVLGGGVTGLVTALELTRAGANVVVLEQTEHAGGVVKTSREGDWLLELGPNSLSYKKGDETEEFLRELGLGDELESRPLRDHDRYIWRARQLRRVPTSPLQILRKNAIPRRSITRAAFGMLRPHPKLTSDISIGAYLSPLVGRPVVEQVLAPALAGIYAADPFALSLESIMPRLHKAAMQSTSLAGALRTMKKESMANSASNAAGDQHPRVLGSFPNGMSTITNKLVQEVTNRGGEILTAFTNDSIVGTEDTGWRIRSGDGRQVLAHRLVCALPAYAAAHLLADVAPDAAASLKRIYYAPMAIVHIGVRESDVPVDLPGFGYLAARNNGVRSLGMIWSDRIFAGRAPEGHRLFTVLLGGQIDPLVNELPDTELLDATFSDLRTVMKWRGSSPAFSRISRIKHAIPLLEVGHGARIKSIIQRLPQNLWITGNYVTGVSVPACIQSGRKVAREVLATR